jgi:hypothetical protein
LPGGGPDHVPLTHGCGAGAQVALNDGATVHALTDP